MSELYDTKEIMLALGRECRDTRVFRNNTGMAYQSNNVVKKGSSILLHDYRIVQAGLCVGSSDLIGLTKVTITPRMVGMVIAAMTALEIKTLTGKGPTKEQENFISFINKSGGIAGVARGCEQAVDVIKKHPLFNGI